MAQELNGSELVSFIKERQAKQVRMLRQAHGIVPKLVIIMNQDASGPSQVYVRMKHRYAEDILIDVTVKTCASADMIEAIHRYNDDASVQGIIVQLPIDTPELTESVVNTIAPEKDLDGLGKDAAYVSATADAINWLLAGYGVDLTNKSIAVVGQGRLVGEPLTALWREAGYDVTPLDIHSTNIHDVLAASDVVVAAAGSPRLIGNDDIRSGAVVVDAGTTTENGELLGDVDDSVRERTDVSITPKKGGVGPLTIALLFDHLIQACLKQITQG